MPFEPSAEEDLIRRTAREFAEKRLAPLSEGIDRGARLHPEVQEGLAKLGLLGLLPPEERGGAGLGLVSLALVLEELARRSGSVAAVVLAHNLAASALPAQEARRFASGEALATLALAEGPLASSLHGEDALWGSARLFPLAGRAALGLVPHPSGGWAVAPREAEGIAWAREATLGLRGAELGQVVLRGARLPRLEAELAVPRGVGLAAIAAGLGQAAVEESVRFAKDRVQFGQPIGNFEAVRARLADMAAGIDAGRALALQAAGLADRGQAAARLAAEAKALATEAAAQATRAAIKLHGGAGFLKDFPVERLHRDARMLPLLGGVTERQRDLAARALLE